VTSSTFEKTGSELKLGEEAMDSGLTSGEKIAGEQLQLDEEMTEENPN
jgi:hypothetical protein